MTYLFEYAHIVRNQIEALKGIYPELEEDAELLATTVEGETDFERVIDKLVSFVREAETMAEAVKARKDEIAERQKRFERQGEAGRKIILSLMDAAQQPKLTLAEATLSITKHREKLNIWAEEEIPQGYFQLVRKPDTKAITAALKAGNEIPGAELELGTPGLMIRTK
jgi:predicted nuclease with TOPRIM domain